MIWPLDATSQKFGYAHNRGLTPRARFAFAVTWTALAIGMTIALPANAGDSAANGEKLIGTFEIRSGSDRPITGDGRNPDSPAPATLQSDPGRHLSVPLRRNFLTGESAVPQTTEDYFRREAGDRVFFGSGSAEIGTRARTVITSQAEWLKRNPLIRLTIEGHADDGGTSEQNIKVALERAEALRERLIAEGVEPRRIAVISRGREDRLAVCGEPSCMAQNRRAVVVVHAIGAGERVGFERGRGAGPATTRPSDTDNGRKVPVSR